MTAGTPVTYQVTGITPDTSFTAQNTVVQGQRVAFTTSSGYEGAVFVPDGVFRDQAAVRVMIEDQVRKVVAVQALTGTVGG